MTRLETGKTAIVLNRVAEQSVAADAVQTFALTAGGKGIAVSSELSADLPAVYADPTRVLQILIICSTTQSSSRRPVARSGSAADC